MRDPAASVMITQAGWGTGTRPWRQKGPVVNGYRYKPSKPAAVLGIVVGIGMIVFALTTLGKAHGGAPRGFLIFWIFVMVASTGLHAWAAFSKNGSLATFRRVPDDSPDDAAGR